MKLGKKQPLLAYLTDEVIRFYKGDEQIKSIDIVVKKDNARQSLQELLSQELSPDIKSEDVLIILGGKLLYQKAYLVAEETVGEEDREAFYKDLPIAEDNLARKIINTEHKVYLLGTDKTYYEVLMDVMGGARVVLPLSLFSDDTLVHELTREQRQDIVDGKELYGVGDFLADNPYTPQKEDKTLPTNDNRPHEQIVVKESSFNLSGLLKLLGISFGLAIIFFGGFIFLDQNMNKRTSDNVVESTTPTPTIAPAEETVAKSDLTVQILNGTGTPGQAGEAEALLLKAEFANITTGNAKDQDFEVTEVIVSPMVSEEIKTELKKALEEYFDKVEIKESTEDMDYDISITTGMTSK